MPQNLDGIVCVIASPSSASVEAINRAVGGMIGAGPAILKLVAADPVPWSRPTPSARQRRFPAKFTKVHIDSYHPLPSFVRSNLSWLWSIKTISKTPEVALVFLLVNTKTWLPARFDGIHIHNCFRKTGSNDCTEHHRSIIESSIVKAVSYATHEWQGKV